MQRLLYGTSVLRIRRCRASYGILCNEIYNKTKHREREPEILADNRKYVSGHIQWFIKKGDPIEEDIPIKLERPRITSIENPNTDWEDIIVKSNYKHNWLPPYLDQ